MVDEISLAVSIAALVISIFASVPLYLDYFERKADKRSESEAKGRVELEVERFQIFSAFPPETGWGIRILNPSKIVEHCSAEIETSAGLRVGLQIQDMSIYQTKIAPHGRASFRVPKGIVPEGSVVVVKDGTKEILRRNAKDIPSVNP